MTHIDHEREALKLRYLPFNYPAIRYHMREANRLFNERLDREHLRGVGSYCTIDPIMSDA